MSSSTRRQFLMQAGWPIAGTLFTPRAAAVLAELAATPGTPEAIAADESFWFQVQQAFAVDRSMINFNNGGVSPSPRGVIAALERYVEITNQAPAFTMWQHLEPEKETVRTGLASLFGSDREEIAITRNASESLQILQFGFDLSKGDEVLTTTQDYPRMITTFKQRERREGIKLVQIKIPVPAEDPAEIVRRFEAAISPRTKLILISHCINLTGQIMPVRALVELGRKHGVPVLVDGAHAFAQFAFSRDQLDCDYYAVSLHKWLQAPIGTGLLYVRRDKIASVWPLMAAAESQDKDIRKFEEIGTHPAANILAIADALQFHNGIGAARKEARLRYLRDRWARRLVAASAKIELHTSFDPRFSCAIGCVQIEGIETAALQRHLFDKHRIFTTAIIHDEFQGLRVTPSVYSLLDDVDRFSTAMEQVVKSGLPAA